MLIEHRGESTIADTQGMAALTGRRPATIRTVCERGPDGYDHDVCEALLDGVRGEVVALTAADAERYLGIPAGTTYSRVHRGHLRPVDQDEAGRPMYALHHLQA